MKRTTIGLVVGLGILVFSSQAFAHLDPEHRAKKLERLKAELSLTDEQSSKIDGIYSKYHDMHKAEREEMKKKKMERWNQINEEVAATLTPEQRTKYDVLKEEFRKNHGGKGMKKHHHEDKE
jgi:hypothetical protein